RRLGQTIFRAVRFICGRKGGRDTASHKTSHAAPNAPVIRNAVCQPYRSAMGVMITGVMMAPSEAPLYPSAIPRDCRFGGNASEAVRNAPGNAAPSPKPNT